VASYDACFLTNAFSRYVIIDGFKRTISDPTPTKLRSGESPGGWSAGITTTFSLDAPGLCQEKGPGDLPGKSSQSAVPVPPPLWQRCWALMLALESVILRLPVPSYIPHASS
jgi:hypothetical protein